MSSNQTTVCSIARECLGGPAPASFEVVDRIAELVALAGFSVTYEGLFGVKFSGTASQFLETFGIDPSAGHPFSADIDESRGELGKLIGRIFVEEKL
jgi:hypothetical protein